MTTIKMLLLAGMMLSAGMAEAQKRPVGADTQAPAAGGDTQGQAAAPAGDAPAPAPAAGQQAAAPGSESLIHADDPQSVLSALQTLGYSATLGVDQVGDPMISGRIEGTQYNIYFYGCVENADCQYLQFLAGFDLPSGWTLDAANQWNAGKILTTAYLDTQMDPWLSFFVTTTGGMNQANFADAMDWWRVMLADFRTMVGA